MAFRPVLIFIVALTLAATSRGQSPPVESWIDGLRLPPARLPRPKPIEPDVKRDNNGPFRLANEFDPPADRPEPQPAVAPRVYELVDASGRRWTGTDWPSLWGWVQACNAMTPAPAVPQTRIYRGTAYCGPNGCPP